MKKFTQQSFAALVVIVLTLSGFSAIYRHDEIVEFNKDTMNEMIIELYGREFMVNYNRSQELIHDFYSSLPRNRIGDFVYPEQFGGMYINDNGVLVLLTVDTPLSRASLTLEIFSNESAYSGIESRQVNFPYSKLMHIIDFLNATVSSMEAHHTNSISGWGLDVKNNRVLVRLRDYNDEQIEFFRRIIFDSPAIEFIYCAGLELPNGMNIDMTHEVTESLYSSISPSFVFPTVNIWPGRRIYVFRSGLPASDGGSIGYPASRGNSFGFVTATHITIERTGIGLMPGDEIKVREGGNLTTIGHIPFSHPAPALNIVDAAFVETFSFVNFVNSVPQAPLLPINIHPVVGNTIFSVGATTGITSGRIYYIRQTYNMGFVRLYDVILARVPNYLERAGDSGGLAYAEIPGRSEAGVIGIVVAEILRTINGNTSTFLVIPPASNIGWAIHAWPATPPPPTNHDGIHIRSYYYVRATVNGQPLRNGAYMLTMGPSEYLVINFDSAGVGRFTGMQANGEIVNLKDQSIRLSFRGTPQTSRPEISEDAGNLWTDASRHSGGQASGTMFFHQHRAATSRTTIARPSWAWGGGFYPNSIRPNFDSRGIMTFPTGSEFFGERYFINGASRTGFFWIAELGIVAYFNENNLDLRQQSGTIQKQIDAELLRTIQSYLSQWIHPTNRVSDFRVGGTATFTFSNGALQWITTPAGRMLELMENDYAIDLLIDIETELELIISDEWIIPAIPRFAPYQLNNRPMPIINPDGSLQVNSLDARVSASFMDNGISTIPFMDTNTFNFFDNFDVQLENIEDVIARINYVLMTDPESVRIYSLD